MICAGSFETATKQSSGSGGVQASGGAGSVAADKFVFSPYKDTGINMNWNTNVISTLVSGSMAELASDMTQHHASAVTLAFATQECGSETWAGVSGSAIAMANVPLLTQAKLRYIVSTGGAAF